MTEKLFTGTLNHNQNKTKKLFSSLSNTKFQQNLTDMNLNILCSISILNTAKIHKTLNSILDLFHAESDMRRESKNKIYFSVFCDCFMNLFIYELERAMKQPVCGIKKGR